MIHTRKRQKQSREKLRSRIRNEGSQKVRKPAVHESNQASSEKNSNIRFDDVIGLIEVKNLARRLPSDSKARELIFALNDNEIRWIALGQLLLIHKFLSAMVRRT